MYLEEIILDGFKSYANRTVIGTFHPKFNAISGLNGTGKSNILDAICFVMGIKSLAQMRVSKVEELIYKQGQAGVSKASVTLIFRNDDRQNSPIGMSDLPKISITRQIAVGGRERYLMNGHYVRMTDIQTVFQSVQLNVNHPHFLVAQGQITKVINMKPHEILGMIEESAGTRLYELKRSESARRIAVKETKLQEIDTLVTHEIEPAIEDRRKKQEQYTQSLRLAEEINRLQKKRQIYEFLELSKEVKRVEKRCEMQDTKKERLEEEVKKAKEQLISLRENLVSDTKKQSLLCSEIKALKEEEDNLTKTLNLRRVEANLLKGDRAKVEVDIERCRKTLEKAQEELVEIRRQGEEKLEKEDQKQLELQRLHQDINDLRALIEEARTGGISSSLTEGHSSSQKQRQTVREKLVETEVHIKNVEAEVQTLRFSISKWNNDIESMQSSRHLQQSQQTADNLQREIHVIQERIKQLDQEKASGENLSTQLMECEAEIQVVQKSQNELQEAITLLNRELHFVTRVYEENPNAHELGIKGIAAELFRIKKEYLHYALALEEAGKSRLINLVVQDDEVAKRLIEKYKSIRHITCIPLNRIQCQYISDEALNAARDVAKLPADSTDLLRPSDTFSCQSSEYVSALTFVFGQAYLCATPEIAQKISTNAYIKGLAITLQGDYYNPAGSVSGGSQCGLNGLLTKMERLHTARDALTEGEIQLSTLELKRKRLLELRGQAEQQQIEYDQLRITLNNLKMRLEGEKDIRDCMSLAHLCEKRDEAVKKLHCLEHETLPELRNVTLTKLQQQFQVLQGSEATRQKHIEECQQQIEKHRTQAMSVQAWLKKVKEANRKLRQNLDDLEQCIDLNQTQIQEKCSTELPRLLEAEKKAAACQSDTEKRLHMTRQKIEEIQQTLVQEGGTISQLNDTQQALESFVTEAEVQMAKLSHGLSVDKKNWSDLTKKRSALIREHGWVVKEATASENESLTLENFDVESLEHLEALKRQYEIQRKTGKNLMALLEASERELLELKEKKSQLIRDKKKLEEFIEELDHRKRNVLEACWKQVDEFFSSIFSSLLPSCNAHLSLTSSGKIEDGLEMKVTLTGITKNSLGELSGGQRSLVALSLILSLLKYKPAPFYILDEIDAALDISHTQRIGYMIRTQFVDSQFLIVSLKENLFNYANVLFTTSFVNGTSCVTRMTNEDQSESKRKSFENTESHF